MWFRITTCQGIIRQTIIGGFVLKKFNPIVGIITILFLIGGLHLYQVKYNPCFKMLRLHVIANSDSMVDQAIKMEVRDQILRTMTVKFAGVSNSQEAKRVARASLPQIERDSSDLLADHGREYSARAYIGRYDFPTRIYGARVFPPGEYTAVRVVLGEGEGHNWWCVLFPPLCLQEAPAGSTGHKQTIKLKCVELIKNRASSANRAKRFSKAR